MDFAKPHAPVTQPTDLEAALNAARASWIERSELTASRLLVEPPELPGMRGKQVTLDVDPDQFRTVLDEVIENAVFAVAENDGIISLTWRETVDEGESHSRRPASEVLGAPATPRRQTEIIISDTGGGMSPAVVQRVFDPFFSHRRAGRGRGLGLARAHRIIEAHGGRVWVVSQPGEGTSFHIVLPQAAND